MRCEICLHQYQLKFKLQSIVFILNTLIDDAINFGIRRYAILTIKYYYSYNMIHKYIFTFIEVFREEVNHMFNFEHLYMLPEFIVKVMIIFFIYILVYYELYRLYKYFMGLRYRCSQIQIGQISELSDEITEVNETV